MGCRIIYGNQESPDGLECAVLFCSTTMTTFGPVMGSEAEAQAFVRFLPGDPRNYSSCELGGLYARFVHESVCECGEVRQDECDNHDEPLHADGTHHGDGEEGIACELQPIREDGERFICERCEKKRQRRVA